ncbi:MAG: DEAD/DEAH box helicase [Ignavibacteriaceae bacterium]|nr:DEAD/DEAH box helicase [Ignavibacteriaceae bacterium]
MKLLRPWDLKLRDWQLEAARKVKEKFDRGDKDFLCVATPGAGKTIFALRIAHYLLTKQLVERVVVICPTEHLKKQWAENAFISGIDIDPEFENSKEKETDDFFGASLTYAQVGREPRVHKRNCDKKKTFVIFDEIHHLGDELSWGDAIRKAFENSLYRLSISGTPFRRDNNPIPFVNYINSQSVADYVYGYTEALFDKVCRPVYFPAYQGEMEWRVKEKIYKSTFDDNLDRGHASERLRTALDADGKWLRTVLIDADKKLGEMRSKQQDAGGLLITIDQKHARACGKLLHEISGKKPIVVVSDDPKASKKIIEFNNSTERWLVAVKMVSEGVDIPRLRVGVYATNIKSELFFRQAVGRFVRHQKEINEQDAYIYMPKDIVLVEYAKEIELERDHFINKKDYLKNIFDIDPSLKRDKEREETAFEAIHSVATDKIQLELDFGREFLVPEKVEKKQKNKEVIIIHKQEDLPVYVQIEKLRSDIKAIARDVAIKLNESTGRVDWNLPHKKWIKIGGKPIEQETMTELLKRKSWLLEQI